MVHAHGVNGISHSHPDENLPPLKLHVNEINLAADIITIYCTSNGLPQPTFHPEASSVTIPSTAPVAVQAARQKLVASAARIQQIVTEPAEYLPSLAIHYQVLSCLRWLSHFRILPAIPLYGSIRYPELAKSTGVPESQLMSVVRMALTSNFLSQPTAHSVAHNSISRLFVTNPGFIDWINFMTQFSMPSAAAFAEATEKWGATDQKNQTAFNIATRTDAPIFDFFAQSSKFANQFASYMKSVQASHGTSLKHLLNGYDWEGLGEAVIVDVGGSTCSSSIALAEVFSKLKFIVQDLPDTISNSSTTLASQPEAIISRITTQSYDFFTPQPHHGADVYLLRMILHDWPFSDALKILKNHLEALKVNTRSRLVIMDTVLPLPGSISIVEEALLRVRDLTMIQAFNSKERELGEFENLFAKACDQDGSLVLKQITKPPGSVMSVMEVAYQAFQ